MPSAADIAVAEKHGFNRGDIDYMAGRIRNWAKIKGATSRDWAANWENWVADDARRRDKAARDGQADTTIVSRFAPKRDAGRENARRIARAMGVTGPLPRDDFSGTTIEGTIQ
jgi:predicted short-subunit dehydrogenase-like oxidoreductase (DUF2520 family)